MNQPAGYTAEQRLLLMEVAHVQGVRETLAARRNAITGNPDVLHDIEWLLARIERTLGVLADRCVQLGLTREFALLSTGWPHSVRPSSAPPESAGQRVRDVIDALAPRAPTSFHRPCEDRAPVAQP